jgi:hypothetical protein
MQVKIPTKMNMTTSENSIEPVVIEDTLTVDKFDVTSQDEEDLTIKVRKKKNGNRINQTMAIQ